MIDTQHISLIWGESISPGSPAGEPSVSVSLWSEVLHRSWVRFKPGQCPDFPDTKVFIVNIFHTEDSTHVTDIRAKYPNAFILGTVDPSLDIVLLNHFDNVLTQLSACDVIGGRTREDMALYGPLLRKPTIYFPSPIGPAEYFTPLQEVIKEPCILSLDHPMPPYSSAATVAALALLQRGLHCKVWYIATQEATKFYAEKSGLEAEFYPYMPFSEVVEKTAKATLCLDLYQRVSYGRHSLLCATVGTPYVGCASSITPGCGIPVDPYDIQGAVYEARGLWEDPLAYAVTRRKGLKASLDYNYLSSYNRVVGLCEEWIG